jgi:hypothetical protein
MATAVTRPTRPQALSSVDSSRVTRHSINNKLTIANSVPATTSFLIPSLLGVGYPKGNHSSSNNSNINNSNINNNINNNALLVTCPHPLEGRLGERWRDVLPSLNA